MQDFNEMLEKLNPMQRQAVLTTEGPLLLLAGAGSGKTRVLTHRMAYLLEKGVRPFNILAITFTNKAAREMKERVEVLCEGGSEILISTFHSACVRILRREIGCLDYSSSFSIYTADDSERLIADILKELNLSKEYYPVKKVMARISEAKNDMLLPEQYLKQVESDFVLKTVGEVYRIYQNRLKASNALDFDDLIFKTVYMFRHFPDILEKYQNRFRYIMVDEYQDTNTLQYQLIRLLSQKHNNLCVVGDDDQSIYGWRGADIRNILDFELDFKAAAVIRLEQNYRSTSIILDAANEVIKNNARRKSKTLWTENEGGEKITFFEAQSDRDEARYIVSKIKDGLKSGKALNDFAVLYRNNALSRVIEEALINASVPYRLLGGTRFYDRKEIRDIMAYLKVLSNPSDEMQLKRIINVPKRGIGDATIAKVASFAAMEQCTFYEALCSCERIDELKSKAKGLIRFIDLINDLRVSADELPVSELIEEVLDCSGYRQALIDEDTDEAIGRLENIKELISKAVEFEEQNPDDPGLSAFLEDVALVADVDGYNEGEQACVLMTLHSSKGLEFPTVFISGFEDGIFPSYRATMDEGETALEEERRLLYVGITRAKEKLYLTCAKSRLQHGNFTYNLKSRFFKELPDKLLDIEGVVSRPAPAHTRTFSTQADYKADTRSFSYQMPSPKDFDLDFEVGDKVRQVKYGIGEVLDISPAGADYEVTVAFAAGTKKLMAKLSRLRKI